MKTQKSIRTKKHQKTAGAGLGQKQRQKKQGQQRRFVVCCKDEIERKNIFGVSPSVVKAKGYPPNEYKHEGWYTDRDIYYAVYDCQEELYYSIEIHAVDGDVAEAIHKGRYIRIYAKDRCSEITLACMRGKDFIYHTILPRDTIVSILNCILDFEKEMAEMTINGEFI